MEQIQNRRRVNLKQTSKGVVYWDITVELCGSTNEETMKEVLALKEQVEKEIPKQNGG